MRALAHPTRLEVLRRLRAEGPATATRLGEAVGGSPASASYHLRQLARHGFVEEVRGRGVGRERWWRAREAGTRIEASAVREPETRPAAVAVAAAALRHGMGIAVGFLDALERGEVPEEWIKASALDDTTIHVTAAELGEITARLGEVLRPYLRSDAAQRPAGARTCHVSIRATPVMSA